jgi:diguanylate cyclase (GGDEF)-like protein
VAAERIRAAVESITLRERNGAAMPHATISIGVSELRIGESIEAWLGRADEALYRAKHSGRNRVEADRT